MVREAEQVDIFLAEQGKNFIRVDDLDLVYMWNGRVWEQTDNRSLMMQRAILHSLEKTRGLTAARVTHIRTLTLPRLRNVKSTQLDARRDQLTMRNGTLNIKTKIFYPTFFREDYATYCVDYDYDPEATCPNWDKVLREGAPNRVDNINALAKMALVGKYDQRFFVLVGPVGTGKSLVVNTIQSLTVAMIGLAPLHWLDEMRLFMGGRGKKYRRFLSSIGAARCMTKTDIRTGKREAERLKALVISLYNRDRRVVIIVSANKTPSTGCYNDGFWSRIIRIPWENRPNPEDPNLQQKLRDERPGILNRVLEAPDFSYPKEWQEVANEIRKKTEPLISFVNTLSCGRYETDELYKLYVEWFKNTQRKRDFLDKLRLSARLRVLDGITREQNNETRYWVVNGR